MNKYIPAFVIAMAIISSCSHKPSVMEDAPFGWAVCTSETSGDDYCLKGGDPANTVVLKSNGKDMNVEIREAIDKYDVIVFDGSEGVFLLENAISMSSLKHKTLKGVNNAVLRTIWEVTPEMMKVLDEEGVKAMNDMGGGGTLSNGIEVEEERETHTRQAMIDWSGDSEEHYRYAGIFDFNNCEDMIIRNISFEGPGTIDIDGFDLLNIGGTSAHIWVDHCSFTDGLDGNFDIVTPANFITVSWCTFQYTEKAYNHLVSNLVGACNVTFAYNVWGDKCFGRMPLVGEGLVHCFNNYYNCPGEEGCIGAGKGSQILLEGCYFSDCVVKTIITYDPKGYIFRDNIYKNNLPVESYGEVGAFPYKYTVVDASLVPELCKRSGATL